MRLCPICRTPIQEKTRPFCSKTCKERDLLKWLQGSYYFPGEEQVPVNDSFPPSTEESS